MFEKTLRLTERDHIVIHSNNKTGLGCGHVNSDGKLYLIDRKNAVAHQLPEKYKDTPLHHGGMNGNLIMVSLLGEFHMRYYHPCGWAAGLWGWLDLNGNEVIPPQYAYAMPFYRGKAIVCRGEWHTDRLGRYDCDNEAWGVINAKGEAVVPFLYDAISRFENTSRFFLCHKGGWETGSYCVYDALASAEVAGLLFEPDEDLHLNVCCFHKNRLFITNMGTDELHLFDLVSKKWVMRYEPVELDTYNNGRVTITLKNAAIENEKILSMEQNGV